MTAIQTDLRELVEEAAERLADATAEEVLAWAGQTFGSRLVVASSMGDTVLVHLASRVLPGVDVLFLDTGYHFPETLQTRDRVAAAYDVNVRTMLPLRTVAQQDAEHGPRLHDRQPDQCCALRKVEPLERGLAPYDAWVTGMRRDDAATRADIPLVGWDARRGKVKLNPIAAWSDDQVDAYLAYHDVVEHPLKAQGYPSIGCGPCTRAVRPGEDPRAGRWSGLEKTECGLHT